ncbi:MAG: hypothetical protein WBG71_07260 [Leeuwenhoekiella sp.]
MTRLLLSFLFTVTFLQAQETITNQTVIDMVDLGLSTEVIISKINTSNVNFDPSINELKRLKNKGVSPEILSLIMNKSKTQSKTGIYYEDGGNLSLLQPTAFSGTKSNNLAANLTNGILSNKIKSVVIGAHSPNQIQKQEFIFIFDPDSGADALSNTGYDNWWFKMASSPNEFVLVKLKVKEKKNERELVTGKGNSFTGNSQAGVEGKNTVSFSLEDLGNGKFKVRPNQVLTTGEYCFFYQGTIPQGGVNNQSIFDFSIR